MKLLARTLMVIGLVAAQGAASAGPRHHGHHGPRHHHHHHHRGIGIDGAVLGLAIALPLLALASQRAEGSPEVVYLPPPAPPQPVYVTPPAQQAYVPTPPAPVIYPRNGQGPEHLEADSRECNRWATTQQAAMAEAGVFQRAVQACMEGRGYTLR